MKISILKKTVGELVELRKKEFLKVNHEYQRGLRWTDLQKKMFIDSIFRGYSIPAFYFHKKETSAAGLKATHFDIVDGQQRVDAIYSYSENSFPSLNPSEDSGFKFPYFAKNSPCPWGGKRFNELPKDMVKKMTDQIVVVYEISTTNENEIRDLFIRLQGGTPLTPQDKRDSWPGNFTEFVLRMGGKTGVAKWYGHSLFKEVAKVGNESRRRQLVAQIFMLFWSLRRDKKFCDLKSSNIDVFYHSQVGFDEECDEAKRFEEICQKLYLAFAGGQKIAAHYLIHLFLLADRLMEEYVAEKWDFADALKTFDYRCMQARDAAKKNNDGHKFYKYWSSYSQWTRTSSDVAATVQRRDYFFSKEMLELLSPRPRDRNRSFTEFQRQLVFYRDSEECQFCKMNSNEHKISWNECEIHHVLPHSEGGKTDIDNAALVHRDCHPKGKQQTREFLDWWKNSRPENTRTG